MDRVYEFFKKNKHLYLPKLGRRSSEFDMKPPPTSKVSKISADMAVNLGKVL